MSDARLESLGLSLDRSVLFGVNFFSGFACSSLELSGIGMDSICLAVVVVSGRFDGIVVC